MNKVFRDMKIFFFNKKTEETAIENIYEPVDTEHRLDIPLLSELPDEELAHLNQLLPWAAFLVDKKGRRFGQAHSNKKRNSVQVIPDYRTELLEEKISLNGKTVLEAGCFEGIHTISLAQKGAVVTAFDSRIENIVKTMVRCSALMCKQIFVTGILRTRSQLILTVMM